MEDVNDKRIDEFMGALFGIFTQIGYLWPTYNKKMIFFSIYWALMITANLVFMSMSFAYLIDDKHSLFFNIIYYLMTLLGVSLNILLSRSYDTLRKCLSIVVTGFFTYEEPVDVTVSRGIHARLRSELKLLFIVPACTTVASTLVCFQPLIDSYMGVPLKESDFISFNLPLHFWYPFVTKDGTWGKYVALLSQSQLVMSVVLSIVSAYGLYVILSQKFFYEFEILVWSVENLNTRVKFLMKKYHKSKPANDEKLELIIEYCIIENIRHHHAILKSVNHFVKVCNPMLFQAWSIGTISLALTLFEFSQVSLTAGAVAASGALVVAEIANMFVLSKIGQQMSDLKERLHEKTIFIKWYTMSPRIKRVLSIFMIGTSINTSFTAGSLFNMNFMSYSSAMNTAYTYFNLLSAARR